MSILASSEGTRNTQTPAPTWLRARKQAEPAPQACSQAGEVTQQCLGWLHKAEDDTHGHRHSSLRPQSVYGLGAQIVLGKGSCGCHMVTPSSSGPQCPPLYSQVPSGPKVHTGLAYLSGFPQAILGDKMKRDMKVLFFSFTSLFIPSPSCYSCLL